MNKLELLINDFTITNLLHFLRKVLEGKNFKPNSEELDHLFPEDIYEKYESILKIGEAEIGSDDLIVIVSKTNEPLTERTGKKNQYEIAKTVIKHEVKDASLFVFYDDDGNFRFSFIKANYLGTKREITNYKRYTYFVSKKQTNKTFIKQVGGCNFNSLDEIVQAFSVEPLNKQFYQDIAKSFYGLIGGKVKLGTKKVEFDTTLELPSLSAVANRKVYQEFAVRLIGRTIFCWFLKNKKSNAGKALLPDNWLSSKAVNQNYYHAILEKLFFLVLNTKITERKDSFLLLDNHTDIPFLNGGLFEPQNEDYFVAHKANYTLKLPDEWFKELFETLEQYNFTIDENSIYDAEVSIDPEMLGTIFENLLAEIDPDTEKSARKATGSFYTPREIVDYMVEQSLVQYLKTKLVVANEEELSELFKEGGENKFDKKQTKNILEALSNVKILDPACGSGAFPMGALHKIINALQKLDPDASWWKQRQIKNVPNALARKMLKEKLDGESADYVRKLGVIQNSIYGVDIQPIAAEISKLRSFLSLVIDETIIDKAENRGIQALPNLEFKFVTANTLIGLPEDKGQQMGMFDNYEEIEQLKNLRSDYLQSYGNKKEKIKNKFLKVQRKAFKKDSNLFTDQNSKSFKITSWNPFDNKPSSWFDPEWMYGVHEFDIIIGNPPFIGQKGNNKIFKTVKDTEFGKLFHQRRMDYFYFFFHKAIDLAKKSGLISFISTNYYITATYADKLRDDLKERTSIIQLINFNEFKIFESAAGQHNLITILKKELLDCEIKVISTNRTGNANTIILSNILSGIDDHSSYYKMPNQEVYEGKLQYIRLQNPEYNNGLGNILNKIADSTTYLNDVCELTQGIVTGADKLSQKHIVKYGIDGLKGEGIFVLTEQELQNMQLTQKDLVFIKPWFKNSDISQWITNEITNQYLIYYTSKSKNELQGSLLDHFNTYKPILVNRNTRSGTGILTSEDYDSFVKGDLEVSYVMIASAFKRGEYCCISYARELKYFECPKIVVPQRSNKNTFGYNEIDWYASADVYYIIQKERKISLKYILAVLNSKLYFLWFYHKGKRKGEMLELYLTPLLETPIRLVVPTIENIIVHQVDMLLEKKKNHESTNEIESHINLMIYKVYELEFDEVKLIDPNIEITPEEYNSYKIVL